MHSAVAFRRECRSKLGIDCDDSFARWLYYNHLVNDIDSFVYSTVVVDQLLNRVPAYTYIPSEYRSSSEYIYAAIAKYLQMLVSMNINVSDTIDSLVDTKDIDVITELYNSIKERYTPAVRDHYRPIIKKICQQIADQMRAEIPTTPSGNVRILRTEKDSMVELYLNGTSAVRMRQALYDNLYKKLISKSSAPEKILALVMRYQPYKSRASSASLMMSLPSAVAMKLRRRGIDCDAISTPMDTCMSKYYSLFDEDAEFGSCGIVRNNKFVGTAYVVVMPHVEEFIDIMWSRIRVAMNNEAMSMVVIVPDWREPILKCIDEMDKVADVCYRGSINLIAVSTDNIIHRRIPSCVYVLQNDGGRALLPNVASSRWIEDIFE